MKKIAVSPWHVLIAFGMFLCISFLAQNNLSFLHASIQRSQWGMSLYFLVSVLFVMIPFASAIALVPVATALWGWPIAGIVTYASWLTASQLLFEIARRFGHPLIVRLISRPRLQQAADFLERGGTPIALALRLFLPFDISSFALALFSDIDSIRFFLVSACTLVFPAFLYAYVGSLSFQAQLAVVVLCACGIMFFLFVQHARLSASPRRTFRHNPS